MLSTTVHTYFNLLIYIFLIEDQSLPKKFI